MTLIRYNNRFPRFFDDFFTKELNGWMNSESQVANYTLPAVNVKETEEGFELELAVPGMKKEDFKVELDQDMITISAEKEHKTEEKNKEGRYSRREFQYHSFRRSFRLPKHQINGDKVEARYENGILYLNIPKREEAKVKPARQIEIA
ncbi:MAG: Hsp20/alpha crystallin family protein [Cyclobacteriaceae bacterium]